MIVDFHHHLNPRLTNPPSQPKALYAYGIPVYTQHRGLTDVETHLEVMDETGIDVSVLTSGEGMMGNFAGAKAANKSLDKVCKKYKERFRFLAHASPLAGTKALDDVKKWLEICPGAVIPSSFGDVSLDDRILEPLYNLLEKKAKYLFVHPALATSRIEARQYNSFDLYRTVGREFSLITAAMRLICGGVLDRHPSLRIVMSHLGGGIASVVPRIDNFQNKAMWGIADDPVHGRTAKEPFHNYLKRIFFDTGGFFGDPKVIQIALKYIPRKQIVIGTDYPQEIRSAGPIKSILKEGRAQGITRNGLELLEN